MQVRELPFEVENIRFDVEPGGEASIWFDLTGLRFTEPEAMTNMIVDFDGFLEDLQQNEPGLYASAIGTANPKTAARHDRMLERLNAQAIHWPSHLHDYVDRSMDLQQTETERVGWLVQRRARSADPEWQHLSAAAQNRDPSWDQLANRLIDDMNTAVTELYPELNDASGMVNDQLRDVLEFHMHRLANEVVGLVKKGRDAGNS